MPRWADLEVAQRGAWVATLVAAVLVLAGWALSRWPGDRHWLTTAFTYSPQALWPLLPLGALVWALVARIWPAAALDLAMLAIALLGPGGLCLNPGRSPQSPELAVVSHNLFGQAERADEFALAEWLQCDVICLQETDADGFEGLLPGYVEARAGDLRTFVRGRILSTERISPGMRGLPDSLATEVEVAAGRLQVLNVHIEMSQPEMSYPYWRRLWPDYLRHTVRVREVQYAAIHEWLAAQELPVIVAGDFNTPPPSRFCRRMSESLTDCFSAAGRGTGYTFVPHGIPVFRIDYIWAGRGLQPASCRVGPSGPSDHRSVIAQMRFAGGEGGGS